ncbi:hypothetical protein [Rhizobium sp. LjRoot254]|uniref:hypothetical protein n=1 Tax=Rhizobium sp. LjRoot254 TaxID=3342297 RepID=UPI003ECF2C36
MIGALPAAGLMIQPAGFVVPDASDVRFQAISRANGEKDWPFVADSGKLACVRMFPGPVVVFIPDGAAAKDRGVILDANPYAMMINNWGVKNVLLPYDKPEELIRRIAPFVAQGRMLCKHNDGPVVPGAEL